MIRKQAVLRRIASRTRRGLTLFEVLLSLAILAASLAAIAQLVFTGTQGSLMARLESEAAVRCQNTLAELIAIGDPLTSVADQPFPDDPNWTWTLVSQETQDPGLYILQMTVNYASDGGFGEAEFTLNRMYRDPNTALLNAPSGSSTTGGAL